ncbi:MAG TPA: hypothetical protein VMK65_02720 [Longimicrobiales bacterium]|nr:hypothetical protein [Longimicrobiales bacterium]
MSGGGRGARERAGMSWRGGARALLPLLLLSSVGCAGLFKGYDRAPDGLLRADWELRRQLVEGTPDTLLLGFAPNTDLLPDDELLRALYQGALARYAGQPAAAAERLTLAEMLAEDRYTKSVSRSLLSLVTGDAALPYEPVPAERALIHYFGALAWLDQDHPDEAAVEARRLSALLDRAEADGHAPGPLAPFLRTFAGAVFEAAGEWNDAGVAYRKAAVARGASPDSVPFPERAGDGMGDVVVLVERGFVAHQVEEGIIVALSGAQVERLTGGEADDRAALAGEIAARALLRIADPYPRRFGDGGRTVFVDLSRERWDDPRWREECREERRWSEAPDSARGAPRLPLPALAGDSVRAAPARADTRPASNPAPPHAKSRCAGDEDGDRGDDVNPYLLRMAWPAFRDERPGPAPLRVRADSLLVAEFALGAPLSDAVMAGYDDRREWVLARMVARGATKLALTRSVEKKVGEKDEAVGRLLGFLTNAGTALLEQADTRTWHLLPAGVSMARLRLPPGTHTLSVEVLGAAGATRTVELPGVRVRAGEVAFASTRLWR